MKQKTWEAWLIASVILFGCLFFVGTLEGSAKAFPNFLWGFIPSVINLSVCVYYGTKPNNE